MRRRRQRSVERTGVLRARLIVSILLAALLPFVAAWWIAKAYVTEQARSNADVRLAFTARSAATEAETMLAATRARALALARDPRLQRAVRRGNRAAVARLLHTDEAVRLAPVGARKTPMLVGAVRAEVPKVTVDVVAGRRKLATVLVSAPAAAAFLARVEEAALAAPGDAVVLVQRGRVAAGPAVLAKGTFDGETIVSPSGDAFRARAVTLPGYDPPARIVAVASGSFAGDDPGALRGRLTAAAILSLLAIALLVATLARPLLQSLGRVADVAEQAMIDPLTSAANRRGFERALAIELQRSERRGHSCALVVVDLDDFKQVNDRYGHGVGDDVLVTLADRLRDSMRSADTVARLGGEEFALLLPETDLSGAVAVAERARQAFEHCGVPLRGGSRLAVTASFGVADFPAAGDRAALMRQADEALYAAKRLGKNRVVAATRAVEAA